MPEQMYVMDDATFTHLTTWCESGYAPFAYEEADAVRERIMAFLQSECVEDAEWHLNCGWPHLYEVTHA